MAYIITYNSNNMSGDTYTQSVEVGTGITLKDSKAFTTDGYELYEWNTSANGSGTSYEPGTIITPPSNMTLYAIWKIHNFGQLIVGGVDISDMLLNLSVEFGKNQPFSLARVQIIKQVFNDTTGYWANRAVIEPGITRPEMVQGETLVSLNVFGINATWVYQKIENDTDDYFEISCVNRAYLLKYMKLSAMCVFIFNTSTRLLNFTFLNKQLILSNPVTSADGTQKRYTFTLTDSIGYSLTFVLATPVSASSNLTPTLESVTGTGDSFFKFFAKHIGGYTSTSQLVVDDGYQYDFSAGLASGEGTDIKNEYTTTQIENMKNASKKPLTWQFISGVDANTISTRLDLFVWDILNGIGLLSNRTPFFYDKAYFVDYNEEDASSTHKYQWGYGSDSSIVIKYGGKGESEQRTIDGVVKNCYIQPMTSLAENEDQGSQYLIQSQTVFSENYQTTITISDANTLRQGGDIKFLYPDKATGSNKIRNYQTKFIALTSIIKNFHPGDSVFFTTSESDTEQIKYIVNTYAEMNALTTMVTGDQCSVNNESVYNKIYTYNGSQWIFSHNATYTNPSRVAQYAPYTMAEYIVDEQNAFTIHYAPLSYTVIQYPSCLTKYLFGEPSFTDSENMLSNFEKITGDSILDKTDDVTISDKYSAKLVFGNQSLEELTDTRTGFTGLILEKNWSDDIYRLAGYSNGSLQAQFNTQGQIEAGGGAIRLSSVGLKTYNTSNVEQCSIGTDGIITAGSGAVKLSRNGLQTYNSSNVIQCSLGTDGSFSAASGDFKIDSNAVYMLGSQTLLLGKTTSDIGGFLGSTGGTGITQLFGMSTLQMVSSSGDSIMGDTWVRLDGRVSSTVGPRVYIGCINPSIDGWDTEVRIDGVLNLPYGFDTGTLNHIRSKIVYPLYEEASDSYLSAEHGFLVITGVGRISRIKIEWGRTNDISDAGFTSVSFSGTSYAYTHPPVVTTAIARVSTQGMGDYRSASAVSTTGFSIGTDGGSSNWIAIGSC